MGPPKRKNIRLCPGLAASVVSMLASGTQVRGFKTRPMPSDFFGRKNPQHAFLRKGSKAVCPVSQICGTLKKTPCDYMEVGSQG
jgi:hypothetical protein